MESTRTWLITGASGGLGLALARAALAAGHRVVATTRGASIPLEAPSLTVVSLDPADRTACRRVVDEVMQRTGRLDVLVNNAGYGLVGALEEVSEEEARAILDVDLLGPLWLSQAALPVMRRQGEGHVVQVSSVGAVGAMPFLGLYNAAKWGLEGLSEAMAGEARAHGVRVTIAEVGAMDTDWATSGMRFARPSADYDALRAETLGTAEVPWPHEPGATGGGASPADIARALLAHVDSPEPGPLRLVLGEDAPAQITAALDARRRDYAAQVGFRPAP